MKKRELFAKIAAVTAAVGFGLLLLCGQLSSSDFPRYTYQPPPVYDINADSLYAEMGRCGFNRIWNAHQGYGYGTTLGDYLGALFGNGMKSVLMKAGGDPLKIEYYSYAQRHKDEADWDYGVANDQDLDGWYYFWHGETWGDTVGSRDIFTPTDPPGGASWQCRYGTDSPGLFLQGPGEVVYGNSNYGGYRSQTPYKDNTNAPGFLSIFRVKADVDGLASTDSVFRAEIYQRYKDINGVWTNRTLLDTGYLAQSFTDDQWISLEAGYTLPDTVYYSSEDTTVDMNGAYRTFYRLSWQGNCDLWVDWIEYMDSTRAYYLFYVDPQTGNYAFRDSVWNGIYTECSDLESDYGDSLYACKK